MLKIESDILNLAVSFRLLIIVNVVRPQVFDRQSNLIYRRN